MQQMLLRTPRRLFRWSFLHLISWLSWFSWSSPSSANIIIIVFIIIMIFPAPLLANAEQHLCREQQHDHIPHSHRHHLATLHCQTNPEKGAFSFGQRGPLVLPSIGPYVGRNSFSVLLLFHKIMDYTVLKLGWHAKCTWFSFHFQSRGPF